MATLEQLETALVKADRAGDTKSARIFAKEIKNLRELRSIDDYNIFAEASKSAVAGGAQTVLMTMDTLGTMAAEQVESGVPATTSFAATGAPFQTFGPSAQQSQQAMEVARMSQGQARKQADEYRNWVRNFNTDVLNIDEKFIRDHPYLYGSMQAIGQLGTQVATGGMLSPLITPQLYSEFQMEAERRLGKPRSEWTSDETNRVNLSSLPYLALASTFEAIGAKGAAGDSINAFLRGGKIPSDVLKRGFNSVGQGFTEGLTEYSQAVLQDITQIVADLDPNEEVSLDTFFGQDKRVAAFSGLVGGTTVRGVTEAAQAIALPKATDADAELLFDSKYRVRFVDVNGNAVEMEVNGPDKETVARRVKESGNIMEGSPITVDDVQGATGSSENARGPEGPAIEQAAVEETVDDTNLSNEERIQAYYESLTDAELENIATNQVQKIESEIETTRELIEEYPNKKVYKDELAREKKKLSKAKKKAKRARAVLNSRSKKQEAFVPNDTSDQLTLPEPSQEEAAEAMATYVNKKYVGETPSQVPSSPGYAAFLQSLGVQKYSEGRFIEISGPNKGRDLTDLTFAGGSVSVIDGKPILITEDREISDLDLKSREAVKEYGGTLVRTNLFRKGAGWKWVDNPSNIDTNTIVSVQQKDHFYTMDYQINNPVKLENDPKQKYVQGRPLSRGKLTFGKKIGKISVRGKEHPLYDRITVGDPATAGKDIYEIKTSITTSVPGGRGYLAKPYKYSQPITKYVVARSAEQAKAAYIKFNDPKIAETKATDRQNFNLDDYSRLRQTAKYEVRKLNKDQYSKLNEGGFVSRNIIPFDPDFDDESAGTFSPRKSGPVSIERVRQQAKLGQAFAKDTAAFYDFYLRQLRITGNLLKANNKNIRRVAEQMVEDTGEFLANNPHLASFYEEDTILTNSYLNDTFDMYPGDEKLYALIDGLMSANTKLKGNAIDSLRAFQSYKKNGNFDDMVIYQGKKGMKYDDKKSKYVLHGASSPNKARAVKAVGKLLQEMSVEETINYLTTPVSWNELKRFNKYLGYKSDPKKGELQVTVQTATGQDTMFPRVFVFGPKVGSYVMNNLGYLNYTTIDIWESRFIRSYFKGMLDETKDLPETVEERDFFQRVGEQFKIVYEERTGQKITKATAQALRWFYVLDTFAKLGYKGASTNESKSEYTREGIREVLGVDLPSGRRSSEESGQAATFESQAAGQISTALRSRFSIRRNYDQISYRGRESTDPRRGYTDAGRGNVDLELSDFVSAAKSNKDTHPFGSSVDVLSEDDYVNHTLILYRSNEGGTVTASISEDGELGTITATKGKTTPKDVTNTIMAAIGTGRVRWANAFDTVLPARYVPLGFKPVIKLKFDPKQAPKDWDQKQYAKFNGGKPDVVFFAFDGEFNRQYSNFKDIPVTDDYITAVDAVQNTEVTGQHFKNPGELMDTVLAEFTPIAKTIGVELEYNLAGPPAIYVAWSPSNRRGKYITFNPYTLIDRSREGVRAAIREELMHGVHHEIALKLFPNERDIGVPWSKLMTSLGKRMTTEQRNTLQAVYSTLPNLSEAKDDLELQNIYKKYGSEYLRVSYQHQLFDETPEMFVEGGASWDEVTKLFKQSQKFLGDKLNLKDVRGDMNLAQLVIDSVDVIKSLDITAPVSNQNIVEAAYAAVPERKQSKPMNTAQKVFNNYMVPYMRNLEDIHPVFRQLEIDLNFNILTKQNERKQRAKRFIDRYIKDVKDPAELARLAHFISFNPRTKEELNSPFGQYMVNARNELLKKYGLYDDFVEVIRPMMNDFNAEIDRLQIQKGFRYEYFPRYIKNYKGLRQAIDPRNLGAFETLVDEENDRRKKAGTDLMNEDERAALLTQFLRGGLRTQPIGVSIPQNAQQRLIDVIPQELTQYYDHPAAALIKYIDNMTDTIETLKVYGQYKMDESGNGVLTGEFGIQALRLYESGKISSYELNERLPELIKAKLAHRGKAEGVEWLPFKQARSLAYMMTIGKFSTAYANLLDLEIALYEGGPTTTLRALITNNEIDLKKMGILAGADQNEFNFDAGKLSELLMHNLTITGFSATDAFGKRAAAQTYLLQAQKRAKQPINSKEYKRLEKDIELFFPLKSEADRQNLIRDLRLEAKESMPVFNYIFSKMSEIQVLSEANRPPWQIKYPMLNFMWQLNNFAIQRLNKNRKAYIDDIISGDPKRMSKGTYNMTRMALALLAIGVPWELLMSFMKGQPFYLSLSVLNTLARLGYGNIYAQKKLILEGPAAYLTTLLSPALLVVGEASTDAYKVMTGQKPWDEADAIKRTLPFKELWDLLSGERDEAYKRTWKREAENDNFPLLNSEYLGGR